MNRVTRISIAIARRGRHLRAGLAALALVLIAQSAAAADLGDMLRGSFAPSIRRLRTPLGRGLFRWTARPHQHELEFRQQHRFAGRLYPAQHASRKQFQPSGWTTLPSNIDHARSVGAFLGYNFQWDQLVLGIRRGLQSPVDPGSVGERFHHAQGNGSRLPSCHILHHRRTVVNQTHRLMRRFAPAPAMRSASSCPMPWSVGPLDVSTIRTAQPCPITDFMPTRAPLTASPFHVRSGN